MEAITLIVIDLAIGILFNDKIRIIIAGINKIGLIWKSLYKARLRELFIKVKGFFKDNNR